MAPFSCLPFENEPYLIDTSEAGSITIDATNNIDNNGISRRQ